MMYSQCSLVIYSTVGHSLQANPVLFLDLFHVFLFPLPLPFPFLFILDSPIPSIHTAIQAHPPLKDLVKTQVVLTSITPGSVFVTFDVTRLTKVQADLLRDILAQLLTAAGVSYNFPKETTGGGTDTVRRETRNNQLGM